MTHEEIQSAYRTYRDSRGTPAEGDAADAFVAAVLSYEDNLPRALLDLAFWVACEAKKAEKPQNSEDGAEVGNTARFVHFARKVIALRGKIRRLPEGERKLTGAEARAYAWAVYAVATKGDDEEEVRASAELFERIYSFRTAHGWVPDEKDKQALERVRARIAANWTKVQEARVKAESGDVAGSVQCYHEAMQTGALSGSDARGYGWAMVKRVWRQDVQERELRFLMGDLLRLSQDALPLESENARKIRHGFLVGVSMGTLVLNRKSLSVKLESKHLVVHDHVDGSLRRVPLVNVDRVVVCGEPAITFPVLAELMDRGIPCSFLKPSGMWRGLMDGDGGFHADRRALQYERLHDAAFCFDAARRVVMDKLANGRRSLQKLFANRGLAATDDRNFLRLGTLARAMPTLHTTDELRGLEGLAAVAYFAALARFFPEDCPFVARSRRPPRNAANALLSFVYTLLAGVFMAAVRAHGLDVAAGFFHCGHDRSPALALDLMEPCRPVLADRLALDLLNHRRLRVDEHFAEGVEGGVALNEEGRRIVFRAFDAEMGRTFVRDGRSQTVRAGIDGIVCRYLDSLYGAAHLCFYRAA